MKIIDLWYLRLHNLVGRYQFVSGGICCIYLKHKCDRNYQEFQDDLLQFSSSRCDNHLETSEIFLTLKMFIPR
jgi:hypothetical protein